MAVVFAGNEGMKAWGGENKGFCIVSVSDGSKVVSKESLVTSLRDPQAWECTCLNNFHRDFPLIRAFCCQFSEALAQRSPAVNRGQRLKFGPSRSRDSILQLFWKMRLWIDVRGYLRAREETTAEGLCACCGFSHTESNILYQLELSGNLKLRSRYGCF